jgi:phosphoribosylcarboxyaminoimidazole (NCAIR) mutase
MVVLEPENAALATAKMLGLLLPELQTRVAEAQEAERQRVLSSEL